MGRLLQLRGRLRAWRARGHHHRQGGRRSRGHDQPGGGRRAGRGDRLGSDYLVLRAAGVLVPRPNRGAGRCGARRRRRPRAGVVGYPEDRDLHCALARGRDALGFPVHGRGDVDRAERHPHARGPGLPAAAAPLGGTVQPGAIMGVGATRRLSAVRWGVATRIVWAWILTIPASALVATLTYWGLASFFR